MYRKIERFSITCLKSRIYFFNFGQCIQTSQSQRKANSCIRHARWKTTVDFAFAFYWMKPWSNILTEIQSPTNHANTCDSQMKKNYVILAIKAKSVTSNAINDKRTRRINKNFGRSKQRRFLIFFFFYTPVSPLVMPTDTSLQL